MRHEELVIGRVYRIKQAKKYLHLRLEAVRTEGDAEHPVYAYECVEVVHGKRRTVKGAGAFIDEVVPRPKANDFVHIVVGKHRDGLGAKELYRVESVDGDIAVLVDGKKRHKVPVSHLRIAETDRKKPVKPVTAAAPKKGFVVMSELDAPVVSTPVVVTPTPARPMSSRFADRLARLGGPLGEIVPDGPVVTPDPQSTLDDDLAIEAGAAEELNRQYLADQKAKRKRGPRSKKPGPPPASAWNEPVNLNAFQAGELAAKEGEKGADPSPTGAKRATARPSPVASPATSVPSAEGEKSRPPSRSTTVVPRRSGSSTAPSAKPVSAPSVTTAKRTGTSSGSRAAVASAPVGPTEAAKKWAKDNDSTWVPEVSPDEAEINYAEATPEEAREILSEIGTPTNYVSPGEDEMTALTALAPRTGKLAQKLSTPKKSRDASPHLIVEARAGTGKTTTLVEGIKRVLGLPSSLTPSPQQEAVWREMERSKGKVDSICFVAFNKSIATELQTRVPAGVAAMTMHSMGFKAVKAGVGNVRVENYRVSNIVADLMHRDSRELRFDPKALVVSQMVNKLVDLCKMNLVGFPEPLHDEEWAAELDRLVAHYDIEVNGNRDDIYALVPQVLNRCINVKEDMQVDFCDMIWLPVVLDLPVTRYDLLLVDEAQDLNRCQQALAKKAGNRLVLCGDPKQAIYGFAGADSESMDRMHSELCADQSRDVHDFEDYNNGAACVRLPLTVTRRCGKAIVEEAKKIVPDFEAFESNGPGKISEARYPEQEGPLLRWEGGDDGKKSRPVHETVRLPVEQTYIPLVHDGDFIVCRVNAPLVSQCFRFLKMGKRATIQGREIGKGLVSLIEKLKATDVVDLVKKLSDWYTHEDKKENAKRNPNEARLIALEDKYSCLLAFTEGFTRVEEVTAKVEAVFTDDGKTTGIRLSSIHKAKGLEARRVFFLMPEGAGCPHPMASSAWQREQEMNLKYVAITRAIEELVYVS